VSWLISFNFRWPFGWRSEFAKDGFIIALWFMSIRCVYADFERSLYAFHEDVAVMSRELAAYKARDVDRYKSVSQPTNKSLN
jgi:hypothetical protein